MTTTDLGQSVYEPVINCQLLSEENLRIQRRPSIADIVPSTTNDTFNFDFEGIIYQIHFSYIIPSSNELMFYHGRYHFCYDFEFDILTVMYPVSPDIYETVAKLRNDAIRNIMLPTGDYLRTALGLPSFD